MKCEVPFSEKKSKKNISNLLSAELAQRLVNVNTILVHFTA